jgi:hypothetical protein
MENGVKKLEFFDESLFVDVLDQYLVWRLNDLIENEEEAKIRRACFVLRAYLTPEAEDD